MDTSGRQTTSRSARGWVLALTAIGAFMVGLDTLVVASALTAIRMDFDASIETLQWTVNAYNLSFGVLLMTAGSLGDRFGRRRLFMAGLGLFAAASAACALAPGAGWLIAARAVQGAGAALVLPLGCLLTRKRSAGETRLAVKHPNFPSRGFRLVGESASRTSACPTAPLGGGALPRLTRRAGVVHFLRAPRRLPL